ncbi:hypothetical protein E2C01_031589 [Portunus trituberculatus]|uniref:Uncharacterized protein n=1 Tax=Portunus trituberculatus TaxID=210409 RepID=A0A5B7EYI7_PORTR|nr:hypothetical protein [Portunus trituberculatus]
MVHRERVGLHSPPPNPMEKKYEWIVENLAEETIHKLCVISSASLSPQLLSRQATLRRSTSCLHAASTMPHKATFRPGSKKHNFLPFKDKLGLIRKCEAGIAQCCYSWDSHDLANKHSPVEATMGDTHQRIAQEEYLSCNSSGNSLTPNTLKRYN